MLKHPTQKLILYSLKKPSTHIMRANIKIFLNKNVICKKKYYIYEKRGTSLISFARNLKFLIIFYCFNCLFVKNAYFCI